MRNIGLLSKWGLADPETCPYAWVCNVGLQAQGLIASREFHKHLRRLEIPHALHAVPDVGHSRARSFLNVANVLVYSDLFMPELCIVCEAVV
jgi:hypothetical protein